MDKKICKGCGRNRKIGKFGQRSRMKDGKNPYCRDCMREYNKRYKKSPKGKSVQELSIKKYKKKKEDEIKEYNKQYYIKNRQRILYNKKCRETTESVNIFDEDIKKIKKKSINKSREVDIIVINPKRKK